MVGIDEKKMTLVDHLRELRRRLIVSIIIVVLFSLPFFIFYDLFTKLLYLPIQQSIDPQFLAGDELLYLNSLVEPFLVKLKVSVILAIFSSSPIHLINLLGFIFPALSVKAKRAAFFSSFISLGFAIGGLWFSYNEVLPLSISFLASRAILPLNGTFLLNYSSSVLFVIQLLVIFTLLFQLPIILELLMIFKVVSRKSLLKASRYVVVALFVVSAIVSPPDIVSQITLAIPLTLLYFLAIGIARIFKWGEE